MSEFLLPDVGEGLTEAEIVSWKVKPGDTVAINDVIVEIETAKSIVELPSPYAGVVSELLVAEGATVQVGTPIIRIGDTAPTAGTAPTAAAGGSDAAEEKPMETLVGYGPRETSSARRPRRRAGATALAEVPPPPSPPRAVPAPAVADVRVLAKPPVRKLAKELGVDLRECPATGPHGTVTRADVEALAGGQTSDGGSQRGHRPHDVAGVRETREPIKGLRKAMGAAMVQSATTIPHVTEWVTVDVTRTVELVERLRAHRDFRDVKVSPMLVVAKAAMLALRRSPEINSTWDDGSGEVVLKHYVNLGIAAATPRGLVVPNVKDAHELSLRDLAVAINELAATARDGRTQPADMSGGTFTITNIGVFGVDGGTPIINPGESAILCMGAVKRQPWVVGDAVVPREVCTLALSFDHRHIDGATGSRFLADVAGVLEDPATALLL